jgi:hypothetical protein
MEKESRNSGLYFTHFGMQYFAHSFERSSLESLQKTHAGLDNKRSHIFMLDFYAHIKKKIWRKNTKHGPKMDDYTDKT